MKNSICTLLFFSITSFTLFSQSIIQVNNNNDANADYTTLQAAIDAATAGAIIYLHPSGTSYGDATIAKRLSIIGPGYNIGMNAAGDTNVNLGNAIVGAINFNTGSNNSSITGCSIGNIIIAEVANILIQRNEFRTRSSEQIVVTNSTNIIINANYFEDVTYTHIVAFSDGVVISNNIIFSDDSRPIHGSGLIIRNNIFFGYCTVDNSVVENNISFGYYPIRGSNNQIQNNVFTDDRAYPDNQTNISSSSI